MQVEETLADLFRYRAIVVFFVQPIPELVVLGFLFDRERGVVPGTDHVGVVLGLESVESRSREDERVVDVEPDDDRMLRQEERELRDGDFVGGRSRQGNGPSAR